MTLIDTDPFGNWLNAIPDDIRRKLSLHDLNRLWQLAADIHAGAYVGRCGICGKTPCDYHGHHPVPAGEV